ncbi:4-(cytidine 5'-diphospho)-2-C-methyl-D-erythritol kinase [Marinoscillum furvescens]|uniref:4-diphosphocytidyl-2-C-methyl-D-erythritol kinase n=1 Tax=Marinoscillum furvescens DSM 4134 TaxID=1122208 RepID=A0A3D9KZ38_MARFU|nr:4-(cytidine 5'-diphospho)-2-C-methyl-D-erythritol kinase [Marinoscillum furvescens]RED93376.1 4-diphosphocytidyl-2-C-methyl-D-erythritol kinase [Marinoscillum furvescens DSM 4134]
MLSFPNAKINLGLYILSRRPDGYHNIESCFYPIPWKDVLEIIPADTFRFTSTGLEIPGDASGNLCVKAYELLNVAFKLPPVHIHLHKVIPMGAGLGGGSADGAFTLKVLNELFELQLSTTDLQGYAAKLGSDCPFFIENLPTIATGTGTTFSQTDLDLSGYWIALKHPGIHIGTKEAYANVIPTTPKNELTSVLAEPIHQWKGVLLNDFEASVCPNHPAITSAKEDLYNAGALYASMTGSGSTVYGLFKSKPELTDYTCFQL